MKRALGTLLGALAGLAFSTLGLTDMSNGFEFMRYGGNDATPTVIVLGIAVGALLGMTVLWRWPLAIVGLVLGLAVGMWMRDNVGHGGVQPPWVSCCCSDCQSREPRAATRSISEGMSGRDIRGLPEAPSR